MLKMFAIVIILFVFDYVLDYNERGEESDNDHSYNCFICCHCSGPIDCHALDRRKISMKHDSILFCKRKQNVGQDACLSLMRKEHYLLWTKNIDSRSLVLSARRPLNLIHHNPFCIACHNLATFKINALEIDVVYDDRIRYHAQRSVIYYSRFEMFCRVYRL